MRSGATGIADELPLFLGLDWGFAPEKLTGRLDYGVISSGLLN